MINHKWTRAGFAFGLSVGFFLAAWVSLVYPVANLLISAVVGIVCVWLTASAKNSP